MPPATVVTETDVSFNAELTATPRRGELMGLSGWRIPAVAVQEQVLRNNVGRMLVRQQEIAESAERWLDMPVTVEHPTVRGQPVSGRTPEALNEHGVGRLVNAREEEGQLKVDVFLFDHRLEQLGVENEIVERVDSGEPIEVSTGFGGRFRRDQGEFQNEEYDVVAEWIDPDHFAILLDEQGACSVEDGCGLGINVLQTARTRSDLAGSGEVAEGEVPDGWPPSLSDHVEALDLEPREDADGDSVEAVDDLTQEGRDLIASHSLIGDPDAESFDQLSFFPAVDPDSGEIQEGALRAVISGRGAQADVSQGALESARGSARSILEEEDLLESEDDGDADDEDAQNVLSRLLAFLEDRLPGRAASQEELSLDDRRELVSDALEVRWGGQDRFVHVVELFEESVVFEVDVQGGEDTLWRADYEIDEEAREATLGERETVEAVVEFVPAENGRVETVENYLPVGDDAGEREGETDEFTVANGRVAPAAGDEGGGSSEEEFALQGGRVVVR